jgi:hypothetical protein
MWCLCCLLLLHTLCYFIEIAYINCCCCVCIAVVLFHTICVVPLKTNKLNSEQEGFVEIVSGGPEVGAEIVKHPLIEELIMTGGACTYDKIVWGFSPEEQMNNKKSGKKLCTKKFDAELGAVSPYIIGIVITR